MANIYRHSFARGWTGAFGEQFVSHQTRSRKTLSARRPRFDDTLTYTETQDPRQAALHAALTYASFAEAQGVYRRKAEGTGVTAYILALVDWFGAPRVLQIDVDRWTGTAGQVIRVKARDNVAVTRVMVVIRDHGGNIREVGEAMQGAADSPWWYYTTQSLVPMLPYPSVQAIAHDRAGNSDSFTVS